MPEPKQYPRTPDGRYFVVRGRLWRLSNPKLGEDKRERLVKSLMRARSALRGADAADRPKIRARIDKAKLALGERGPVWWTDGAPDFNRHLAKNTPYRSGGPNRPNEGPGSAFIAARPFPIEPLSRAGIN